MLAVRQDASKMYVESGIGLILLSVRHGYERASS